MGLVLNRAGNAAAGKMLSEIEDLPECGYPILSGGPVGLDQIYVLYRRSGQTLEDSEGVRLVGAGVHLVGNLAALQDIVGSDEDASRKFRLYAGYAGWGPGQLDHEMDIGSWFVARARPEFVFDMTHEEVWSGVLKSMGGEYRLIAAMPDDLSVN